MIINKFNEDVLRDHINPQMIEKAPEGFTMKVMSRINMEASPFKVNEKSWKRFLIPLISAGITLVLILAAFLLPGDKSLAIPGLKLIQDFSLPAFSFNFDALLKLNIPAWFPYIFIGILFLTIFDRGLSRLFYREK
jgi:hypothetical protein